MLRFFPNMTIVTFTQLWQSCVIVTLAGHETKWGKSRILLNLWHLSVKQILYILMYISSIREIVWMNEEARHHNLFCSSWSKHKSKSKTSVGNKAEHQSFIMSICLRWQHFISQIFEQYKAQIVTKARVWVFGLN